MAVYSSWGHSSASHAVSCFHSARPGRNGWYETFRPGLKPMMRRLAVSTAVSEDARRQVTQTFGGDCEILPNGVDVARLSSDTLSGSVREFDHQLPSPYLSAGNGKYVVRHKEDVLSRV